MKRHSKKRAAQERRLVKIREELIAEGKTHCFFFPHKYASGGYDHIVPRSQNTDLIDCKENLVPTSSEAHYIITNGTNSQIQRLPRIKEYLAKMKELDESYWRRFLTNHELWEI